MSRHHCRRRTAWRDDEGSLILAMLASMIVLALLAVIASTAMLGHRTARHDRDYTAVFQVADAGVQRVVFMLNASKVTNGVLPANYPASTVTGTLQGGSYSAYAQKTAGTRQWTVYSTGTLGSVHRRVVVTLSEDRLFFASVFADTSIGFNGANRADTYNSGADGSAAFTPGPGVYGIVGSNGPVTLTGSSVHVDGVQLWNWTPPNDVLANRCSGSATIGLQPSLGACDPAANTTINPVGVPYQQRPKQPRVFTPSAADLTARAQACGNPNAFSDLTVNSNGQVLIPASTTVQNQSVGPSGVSGQASFSGGYYCYRNVTIKKDVTLGGGASASNPVVLVVTGNVSIQGNGTAVNCVNCAAGPRSPDASALQIYMAGAGTFSGGSQEEYGFAFYGPSATCSGSAGAELYGSLICGNIGNVGGWTFHYDQSLENLGNGQFTILSYKES